MTSRNERTEVQDFFSFREDMFLPIADRGNQNLISRGYWGFFLGIEWLCSEAKHYNLMPKPIRHIVLPAIPHTPSRRGDYLSTKKIFCHTHAYACLSMDIVYVQLLLLVHT
jgi:hypothetical protein